MSELRLGLASVLLFLIAPLIVVAGQPSEVPGWIISGSVPEKYHATIDDAVVYSGSGSASLAAVADAAGSEFGTLMQAINLSFFACIK